MRPTFNRMRTMQRQPNPDFVQEQPESGVHPAALVCPKCGENFHPIDGITQCPRCPRECTDCGEEFVPKVGENKCPKCVVHAQACTQFATLMGELDDVAQRRLLDHIDATYNFR